ncbi:hypothetical protein TBS_22930 [Thermobispora bispora]|uniref:hypothetical protein n=1 Tax=Thermobispora bispora TaxID=2006 RepID=UPI0030EA878E
MDRAFRCPAVRPGMVRAFRCPPYGPVAAQRYGPAARASATLRAARGFGYLRGGMWVFVPRDDHSEGWVAAVETREHFAFQEAAARVKREAACLTGDRVLAAEARTERAEAELCLTWHAIIETVRLLRLRYGVRG